MDSKVYRSRRSWLLAESILGYVAFTVGASGLLTNTGMLNRILHSTGDAFTWGLLFCGAGLYLCAVVAVEAVIRNRHNFDHPWIPALTHQRKILNFVLMGLWAYAALLLASLWWDKGIWIATVSMQAPMFVIIHFRGGWEHVKACRLRPSFDGQYLTVGGALRRSMGR